MLSRPTTRILAILLAASALSACSGAEDGSANAATDEDPIEITFYSYNYGTSGLAGEGTQALLDAFAEEHPHIRVVPQSVPTEDILTRTRADVAAGSAPDVVQMGYSKLNEAQRALPLQSFGDIAGSQWEAHAAGLNPGLVAAGEWEGDVRALPFTVSVPAVFYNADLFAEAGLDPDAPPSTIEDVREAAQAMVGAGHEGVYFAAADSGRSDYLSQSIINSAGGGIVDDAGEVAIDSPEAVEGLAAVQSLTQDGLQPAVAVEEAVAAFSSGDLGMLVVSTAVSSTLADAAEESFELRSTAFPAFGASTARPTHSGAGLVVLSAEEERQRAAWEFVRFLTSEEGYRIITEEMGYLPLRDDMADDPDQLADHFAGNRLLVPSLEALDTVEPYQVFPVEQSNRATVIFQDEAVEPIVLRGADPASTLAEVAEKIRNLEG